MDRINHTQDWSLAGRMTYSGRGVGRKTSVRKDAYRANSDSSDAEEMTAMSPIRLASLVAVLLAAQSASGMSLAAGRPQEVPLWPEGSRVLQQGIDALAGKEWAVTHPSLLIYRPKVHSSRSAILVFPGGGFKALAIGPESTIGPDGAHVCKWLTEAGVTCILVKYRVPDTACNWNWKTRRHYAPEIPMALQDTQRAMSIVRHNARAYGIDPDRIGVMGFSAGGYLAVLASTAFNSRSYESIDAIDRVSSRPDFAIPVYPGHLTMEHKNKTPKSVAAQQLNTDIVVSAKVPPTLLIHARDDTVDPVHYSLVYERELMKAGADVTLIVYDTGGHAFGIKKQGKDTDRWTEDALQWLRKIRML
jgi:acetyl esterase/lipase